MTEEEIERENERIGGLTKLLGIRFTELGPERVSAVMPLSPDLFQPFGVVHGGATLALIETVASRAAEYHFDYDTERSFGIEIQARHWKSGTTGNFSGTAVLNHEEGPKQYWDCTVTDDEGDICSQGTFVTKRVSLERLREKAAQRAAKRI